MRTAPLTAAVAVACLLLACGQKGPLVLPDAQHPHKKLGIPKPASAPVSRPAAPAGPSPAAPAGNGNSGDAGGSGVPGDAGNTGDAQPAPAPQP